MTTSQSAAPGVAVEAIRAALKKAYSLGQTYWQQADSDFESQHKKSDVTQGKFESLIEDTCTALLAGAAAGDAVAFHDPTDERRQEAFVFASDYPDGTPTHTVALYAHHPVAVRAPQELTEDGFPPLPEPRHHGRSSYDADDMRAYVLADRASRVGTGALPATEWLSMDTAPTDGTMVRLLVDYTGEDARHPLEDAQQAQTIGANNDGNVGPEEGQGWLFAGWSWEQDCFTQGHGKPIGWLPLAATSPSAAPAEVLTHTGNNDVSTATLLDESATMLEDYALHQRDLGNDSTAAGADAHAYRLRHLNVAPPAEPASNFDQSVRGRAKRMYAEHPVYQGTKPLSWHKAPNSVKREWIDKAKAAPPAGEVQGDALMERFELLLRQWATTSQDRRDAELSDLRGIVAALSMDDKRRLDFVGMNRVALIPEFEGPWDAQTYPDEASEPAVTASHDDVRGVIDAAMVASRQAGVNSGGA